MEPHTLPAISRHSATPFTVLFAPAHVLVDQSRHGSEYHLPYQLIERLAVDHGMRVIALSVQAQVEQPLPGVTFVSVDPGSALPMSNVERLRFHLQVYAKARAILNSGEQVDVIHHMYPFGLRATFNLLSLLHRRHDPPVVIGPLQSPLSFNGNDEAAISVRDFSSSGHTVPVSRRSTPPLSTFVTLPILARASTWTLRRADALVAYSDQTAYLYGSMLGGKPITVIPPGVNTDVFRPSAGQQQQGTHTASSTADVSLSEDASIRILGVGFLTQRKAFDVLVAAVAALVASGLPVRLRLVGDGPARGGLEALVRRLGIESRVTFAGLVPHKDMAREYREVDIFCSTSLSESFSIVGLEAMSCGLPIVATPTGFFRDALRQERVGTLVRFGAVDQLTDALSRLVTDGLLRRELGHRARELAVREYDWHVLAARYVALYHRISGQR